MRAIGWLETRVIAIIRLKRRTIAEVGDTLHPSLERIIALKPQVVLVSTASQLEVFTQQLQNQNIAVFVTDPHDLEGVFKSIDRSARCWTTSNRRRRWCRNCANEPTRSKQAVKQTAAGARLLSGLG